MGEEAAQDGDEALVTGTLAFLARSIASNPEAVQVEVVPGPDTTTLRLHVDPEDLGRIIGKGGRVARAIRQVTRAAATRAGIHVFIEIDG
jgi:predicted RNA-binding protein YlqC (UPF0109 family)